MIKVLIVDDDPLVRSALSLILGGQPDIEVVGEAGDGEEGLEMARAEEPDVVLMDIRMPKINGLDATKELHSAPEPPRVVVLTTFDADQYVVGAVSAGADGFLLKDTPPGEIVDAVRKVADGEAMLSPTAVRTLIGRIRTSSINDRGETARMQLSTLTEREMEVAEAVGRGLSNADIAAELFLSVPTVKAHVSRLFEKLKTTNRVQIALIVHDSQLD